MRKRSSRSKLRDGNIISAVEERPSVDFRKTDRIRIGINQFCYHRYFNEITPWESDSKVRWKLGRFLERAVELEVDSVSLQTVYLPVSGKALAEELGSRGLDFVIEWGHPVGLKMGTSPEATEDLKRWMRKTSKLGGKVMRIVTGSQKYRGTEPVETQIRRLVPLLRELCSEAADLALILAVENHADFTPKELIDLIEQTDRPNLRIAFDTGNCVRLRADLHESCKIAAPFAEIIHLKDLSIMESSLNDPNSSWPSAPLGRGSFDLPQALRALIANGFQGTFMIELSHMHPNWPDEDKAVEESVRWLKANLPAIQENTA